MDTHEALVDARVSGHIEVAQQLLDHRAKTDRNEIAVAAHKDRWDVVRLLVQRGANIDRNWDEKLPKPDEAWGEMPNACRYIRTILPNLDAVAFEMEDVVREYVSFGATLDGEFEGKAVKMVKTEGLGSMLPLLRNLRVDVVQNGKKREVLSERL
jgi:ankyrin repeat protein